MTIVSMLAVGLIFDLAVSYPLVSQCWPPKIRPEEEQIIKTLEEPISNNEEMKYCKYSREIDEFDLMDLEEDLSVFSKAVRLEQLFDVQD